MSEGQVRIIPRKPSGRKRTGGRKSRRYKGTFHPAMRRLAELLAGPHWRTLPELAELAGKNYQQIRVRLYDIRRLGTAEFIVRQSWSSLGEDPLEHARRGACSGRRLYYQIERLNHGSE